MYRIRKLYSCAITETLHKNRQIVLSHTVPRPRVLDTLQVLRARNITKIYKGFEINALFATILAPSFGTLGQPIVLRSSTSQRCLKSAYAAPVPSCDTCAVMFIDPWHWPSLHDDRCDLLLLQSCPSARVTRVVNCLTLGVGCFETCLRVPEAASRIARCFASSDVIGWCCCRTIKYVLQVSRVSRRAAEGNLRQVCRPPHHPTTIVDASLRPVHLASAA